MAKPIIFDRDGALMGSGHQIVRCMQGGHNLEAVVPICETVRYIA